jgi:TRAP-type C4-dicarboxylate transport system substrate-binding protein
VTNHIYSGLCFTIAESTWKKLTPDQQDIVRTAAEKSAVYDREMNREQTESYLKKLEDAGIIINEPDIGPFRDAAQNVLSESGPILGEVYDRLQQWLAER